MLFTPPACLRRAENELDPVSVGSSFNDQFGTIRTACTLEGHHSRTMMTGSDYSYPIQAMGSNLTALRLAVRYQLSLKGPA